MDIQITQHNAQLVIATLANMQLLNDERDATDLVANVAYQDCHHVVLSQAQLPRGFFNLSSHLAGNILQKFINYRVKLAIVGDFTNVTSNALHAFIVECNRTGNILFVSSEAVALEQWGCTAA